MKTILWATLTANGNYAQSGPENPPRPEALGDFAAQAKAAGNFIVGRRTYEAMAGNGGGGGPFADLDIVVVSASAKELRGVTIAGTPQEALDYLRDRGHSTALLSGGGALHQAFLGQGLVDELIFNIAPVLEGKGLNILLDNEKYTYQDVTFVESKLLGGGVVQLRYALAR